MNINLNAQSELFLSDMNRVQRAVATASQQISSGKRVSVASDSPDVVSEILQLRAAQHRNSQITNNLAIAQTDANVSESALSSATKLMDRAVTLGTQGATATMDAGGRASIASEVQTLLEEMVNFSQTQSGDRYVFSGDQETVPAYQVNLANDNGVDRLITTSATRLVENPSGGSFAVSMTAQDIFDHRNPDDTLAGDNVFAALNALRNGLLNNDEAAITAAVGQVKTASDSLNTNLAFYGTVQNRIQDANSFAGQYDVQIRAQLSQKEDADVAAASLELTQGTAQIQAGFQMEARIPRSTLFDFLSNG